jgi:hypothetical protein
MGIKIIEDLHFLGPASKFLYLIQEEVHAFAIGDPVSKDDRLVGLEDFVDILAPLVEREIKDLDWRDCPLHHNDIEF